MGEIKRFLRDDGMIKVSRSLKELSAKISEAQREEMSKTGEELSILQLEDRLNVSKEEIVMALDSIRPIESIDESVYEEGSQETRISKIDTKVDEMSNLVDRLCLGKLVGELKKKDKEVILLRYMCEKTQTEVAKILGISQVQVSRMEKKILTLMKNKIES